LNETILGSLQELLKDNPFAAVLQNNREIIERDPNLCIVIKADSTLDLRRYNEPTSDEVAVLLPGHGIDQTTSRDVVLRSNDGALLRIDHTNKACDALHYVLLYPNGENGWNLSLKNNDPKITCHAFYRYLLHRRSDFSLLHRSGRLFQQWCVDMWAKVEQQNLRYLKGPEGQRKIRSECYSGLQDAIVNDVPAEQIGKTVILPSTFTSGPRYMAQCYYDAMAIVRRYGKPDLFITFTCNPKWKEIVDILALENGVYTTNYPDILDRVFHEKLKELLRLLKEEHVLGVTIADIYVIEFQKRG
jgi:hypothetical protein